MLIGKPSCLACLLASTLAVVTLRAQPETWTATGSLNTKRSSHTATLLSDGRVLVAGGDTGGLVQTADAELYDPSTGEWMPTGSLGAAKHNHSATLLPDGRVLVAGGTIRFDRTGQSERYDPALGIWLPTGSLDIARKNHTATLLSDGRVLVTGGDVFKIDDEFASSVTELYDPATGRWRRTGSLNQGRFNHSATLLADGRLLVVGGRGRGNRSFSSGELYDPATRRWTRTGSLNHARSNHRATLLADGRVLVSGGEDGNQRFNSAELYDPATGRWTLTGSLNQMRARHSATLLADGRVLVAGGKTDSVSGTASAELYDPLTGSWAATDSLDSLRQEGHTATLLFDGRVLVASGFSFQQGSLDSAELYDYTQLLYPQLALGGGFEVVLLATNQGREDWRGRGELDNRAWPLDRPWTLNGANRTGQSGFDIQLEPDQTKKFTLSSGGPVVSGWLEVKGKSPIVDLATSFFYNFYARGRELEDRHSSFAGRLWTSERGADLGSRTKKFTSPPVLAGWPRAGRLHGSRGGPAGHGGELSCGALGHRQHRDRRPPGTRSHEFHALR